MCTLSLCDLHCFDNCLINKTKEVIKNQLTSQVIIMIRKISSNLQVSRFSNMVLELRCKKETEDHIFVGTMTRVIRKGFKVLGNLATSIKNCLLKIISKLTKEVADGSLFSTLSGTFKDENVWVIDSGASRHITGECS